MSQFPGSARTGLCIQPAVTPSPCGVTPGFPIRTSPDQCLFAGSPGLIAGCHVLHRLSTPRHPPCTLCSLVARMTHCPAPAAAGPAHRATRDRGPARRNDPPHAIPGRTTKAPSTQSVASFRTSGSSPLPLDWNHGSGCGVIHYLLARPTPARSRRRRTMLHISDCQRSAPASGQPQPPVRRPGSPARSPSSIPTRPAVSMPRPEDFSIFSHPPGNPRDTTPQRQAGSNGAERARTANLLVANQALSQLSYGPLACRPRPNPPPGTPGHRPQDPSPPSGVSRPPSTGPPVCPSAPIGPAPGPEPRPGKPTVHPSTGPDRSRTYDLVVISDAL